jgi:chromosome condensin MukBEF ATPase and DNA-binding subunit MukB
MNNELMLIAAGSAIFLAGCFMQWATLGRRKDGYIAWLKTMLDEANAERKEAEKAAKDWMLENDGIKSQLDLVRAIAQGQSDTIAQLGEERNEFSNAYSTAVQKDQDLHSRLEKMTKKYPGWSYSADLSKYVVVKRNTKRGPKGTFIK